MDDAAFMRMALAMARKGVGRTSPNPAVGAVVVKNGRVIGRGFHRKAGLAHAEIEAMRAAKGRARGSTVYVTLEPCSHFGRTPPCTDALIAAGVKRVVAGMIDPNPQVSGGGVRALERAGVEVRVGVMEEECREINAWYVKRAATGMPFVTLKLASSIDGRIATSSGESRWITGQASRRLVHRMRSVSDAVMVGASTVLKDDPSLDVRLVKGRDPVRVVVDSRLRTPPGSKVFGKKRPKGRLIIVTTKSAPAKRVERARSLGAEVVQVRASRDGVDMTAALKELGKMGIGTILAEGGGQLAASLLKNGLVDRVSAFVAPSFIGGDGVPSVASMGLKTLKGAPMLAGVRVRRVGGDVLMEGRLAAVGRPVAGRKGRKRRA